jgi:DNA-binding CsgD family transcriptional regulator
MEMARRIDFRPGLATVLMRTYWSRGPMSLDEVIELLDESSEIAAEIGDIEVKAEAMEWRIAAMILKGDLATAKLDLAVVHEDAARIHQPFILHVAEQYASAIALSEGRLADAERAAERSHEWSRWLTGRDASGVYGVQMFGLRREQGRLAELAPVVRVLAGGDRRGGAWRPALAAVTAELGMLDDTRHQLALLRSEGLDRFRRGLWVASLSYIADACSAVGDAEMARIVYDEMSYLAGRTIMIGHGVAFYGAADRYLGMLAATSGDLALAEQHHAEACRLNRSMGAVTWLAHSLYEHGRTLHRMGRGTDPAGERALIESLELAERIGMPVLVGRIRALGSRAVTEPRLPDGLSPREVEILRRVAAGMSNRDIGLALHISEHTAANHIRNILRKTGCANRTEAASYAHTRGLTGRD